MTFRRRLALAALALGTTFVLAWALPLDGGAPDSNLRALGRLHPLIVHFPIVLLLLTPVFELLGRTRPALREAAGVVLGLAVVSAVAAVFAGLVLARADGQEGALLVQHYRGGIWVAFGTALAWLVRGRTRAGYAFFLSVTLGLLAWTAHNGGSLTHGSDYLTEFLPPAVKRLLHIPEPQAPEAYAPGTVFATAVRPMLEKHCFACHGPERQKGDYRMDTFAALLAGGKSGKAAIVPGDIDHSELVRRLLLNAEDDKVMPPRKKPRATPAEIDLLRWWVRQGAPRDLALAAVTQAPASVTALLTTTPAGTAPASEPAYVPRVGDYTGLREEITRLEHHLGVKLVPVSQRVGDGLILRTRGAARRFGDAELAQFTRIAPFIVDAELAGTQVTDAGLVTLRAFSHLERLHLDHTVITGATTAELRALSQLAHLNLCFTAVTDETARGLADLAGLRQLYLFGSKVTPAGLAALQASLPRCKIGPLAPPESNSKPE